jgi:localization factor PodJL
MSRLGWMFEKGQGVPKNLGEAVRWFRLAAEAGDSTAATHLGWLQETGALGQPDLAAARTWYERGAV